MNFPVETRIELLEVIKNNQPIKIRGINGFGDPFVIEGKIAITKNGYACIESDNLTIDLCPKDNNKTSQFILTLSVNPPKDYFSAWESMTILSICLTDGEDIYKNPEQDKILKMCMHFKNENSNKRVKSTDSDVVSLLQISIGKPCVLDGHKGVIISFLGTDNGNQTLAYIAHKGFASPCYIDNDSYLFLLDKNENIIERSFNNEDMKDQENE